MIPQQGEGYTSSKQRTLASGGAAARACGAAARAFSDALFSRRMLLEYLRTVLAEVCPAAASRDAYGPFVCLSKESTG